jgi:hypothetical protein
MATKTGFDDCWRYIRAIRNTDKREYAIRYLDYLRAYQPDPEPERMGLSTMAAQAVRMRLHEILAI